MVKLVAVISPALIVVVVKPPFRLAIELTVKDWPIPTLPETFKDEPIPTNPEK